MNADRIIAIVGGKGNSKRLPKKTIKRLGGKPLIAWSIEALKSSALVQEVYCVTDCETVAAIARYYGAKVPMLEPPEVVNAHTMSTADTLGEAAATVHQFIYDMLASAGEDWDILISIASASPFISPEDIDNCLKLMIQSDGKHEVRGFRKAREHPWWMKYPDGSGYVIPELGNIASRESRDFPEVMFPVGSPAVFSRELTQEAMDGKWKISNPVIPYVLPPERSIDIDDAYDFYIAKCMAEAKDKVPDFTDLHKGKRAWIFGTGPSLGDVTPEQWAVIDQDITIGVNNSPAVHDSRYLLWCDAISPGLFPSIITSEAEYKFTLGTPSGCSEIPDVIEYTPSQTITQTFEGGLTSRRCSTHAALHLAITMGCNPIILLGLDFKNAVHVIPQLGDDPDASSDPDGTLRREWGYIAKAVKFLDRTIINGCEDSGMDCFPRMSVEDVLSNDKLVIPEPKVGDNGHGPLGSLIEQTRRTVGMLEFANQALPAVMKRLMPGRCIQFTNPEQGQKTLAAGSAENKGAEK